MQDLPLIPRMDRTSHPFLQKNAKKSQKSTSQTVALDVTISENLRREGVARELINRIQNARKDTGLEVTDKIKLTVLKFEDIEESINKNKEYIMSETLTEELVFVDQLIDGLDVEFDTIKSKILINKM